MITTGQALERLAERTVENRELWKRSLTQRRTGNTAIYGIPFYDEIPDSLTTFECHISILPNLEYFTRFQFKLYVDAHGQTIDPDTFKFYMGDPEADDGQGGTVEDLKNLTPYLQEQHNDWVDGTGYFPSTSFGDEDTEQNDFYDILDVCCILTAEDRDDWVDTILSPGNKLVRIRSATPCDVTWIPYIDYSMVNR